MPSDENEREDACEAAERLLREAIETEASEIQLARDGEGATVFLRRGETMESMSRLCPRRAEGVFQYLKEQAGIDGWQSAPAHGVGVVSLEGTQVEIEVRLVASAVGEDLHLRIAKP